MVEQSTVIYWNLPGFINKNKLKLYTWSLEIISVWNIYIWENDNFSLSPIYNPTDHFRYAIIQGCVLKYASKFPNNEIVTRIYWWRSKGRIYSPS